MGLNDTPSGERLHIGIFGRRNAGKSSLINAITNQDIAIVSDVKGTTTDPVKKAMEILPLGPVMIVDTPGIDDEGELGSIRVERAYDVLNTVDMALVVVDGAKGLQKEDIKITKAIKAKELPFITVLNKSDTTSERYEAENSIWVSAVTGENITELKEKISALVPADSERLRIIGDKLEKNDSVVLVIPIDSAAPKGRIILPQQQVLRDVLEAGAQAIVTRDTELEHTLKNMHSKPKVVITDSQAFGFVKNVVPEDIYLTSFSILMARYKGDLKEAIKAIKAIDSLSDGDKILIAEGCTHHRQCDDIGTVKIPRWLKAHINKDIQYDFSSGQGFPKDLAEYKAVIHCGGCTLNEKEMRLRISRCREQGVPVTNYGIFIAHTQGILKRSIELFPEYSALLEK